MKLEGLKVVDLSWFLPGPYLTLALADHGAEVIKVEPPTGDPGREILPPDERTSVFFRNMGRGKKSVVLDIQTPDGLEQAKTLIATADVLLENFRPGLMDQFGLGYEALSAAHPRLIYVSHKGFLPGPYEHRTALDEVVQMMGGLSYMTGPEGRPLRAGTSVNDIMGGMFGAIGAIAALHERDRAGTGTGRGAQVQSALFENNIFLVAQHMLQYAVTGKAPAPMPNRISAWALYDVFSVKDGEQIFLAAVSDTQWALLCQAFGFDDLQQDPRLQSNNDRVRARGRLRPENLDHPDYGAEQSEQRAYRSNRAERIQKTFEIVRDRTAGVVDGLLHDLRRTLHVFESRREDLRQRRAAGQARDRHRVDAVLAVFLHDLLQ